MVLGYFVLLESRDVFLDLLGFIIKGLGVIGKSFFCVKWGNFDF